MPKNRHGQGAVAWTGGRIDELIGREGNMSLSDPRIARLQEEVRAAEEDFELAVMFHETWKPAACDKGLHHRLRNSRAAQTFGVVRAALRREMLMALMRLWDGRPDGASMEFIAETLRDRNIINALAEDRAARSDAAEGAESLMRRDLNRLADEAIALIEKYSSGGSHVALREKLSAASSSTLPPQQSAALAGAEAETDDICAFYQDNLTLIRLLLGLARAVHYDPEDAAKLHRLNATSFWGEVRGERRRTLAGF